MYSRAAMTTFKVLVLSGISDYATNKIYSANRKFAFVSTLFGNLLFPSDYLGDFYCLPFCLVSKIWTKIIRKRYAVLDN